MKKILWTTHSIKRLQERNIPSVNGNALKNAPTSLGTNGMLKKQVGEYVYVIKELDTHYEVITAYNEPSKETLINFILDNIGKKISNKKTKEEIGEEFFEYKMKEREKQDEDKIQD